MNDPHKDLPPVHNAVVKGVTGFIVGIIFFVILAVLRLPPVVGPFVRHIEILGIDLGLSAESFLRVVKPAARARGYYHYVFLDVDQAACSSLFRDDPACTPAAPADRRIVAALVRAARNSGALVVVLDIAATWPGPTGGDPLEEALSPAPAAQGLPPLVLPLRFDTHLQPGVGGAGPRYVIVPRPAESSPANLPQRANVHLALPVAYPETGVLNDGVVRTYPTVVPTDTLARDGLQTYWSLAGVAACLAEQSGKDPASCRQPTGSTLPAWLWYSVPPMTTADQNDPRLEKLRQRGLVNYVRASEELEPHSQTFAAVPLLRDAIVVIGSSRDGRDYHVTPLGIMTGAEIVLNATRSFLEFSPAGDAGLLWSVLGELSILGGTATVFAVFWWVISRHAVRGASGIRSFWHAIVAVTCFVMALAVAVLLTLAIALQSASRYDVLTPVLLTALEGAVEGMHVVIGWVEAGVHGLPTAIVRLLSRNSKGS